MLCFSQRNWCFGHILLKQIPTHRRDPAPPNMDKQCLHKCGLLAVRVNMFFWVVAYLPPYRMALHSRLRGYQPTNQLSITVSLREFLPNNRRRLANFMCLMVMAMFQTQLHDLHRTSMLDKDSDIKRKIGAKAPYWSYGLTTRRTTLKKSEYRKLLKRDSIMSHNTRSELQLF